MKRLGQEFQAQYFLIFTTVAAGLVLVFYGNTLFSALGADKPQCEPAFLPAELSSAESTDLAWPVDHTPRVVTSCFGKRDCERQGEPCAFDLSRNRGINILAGENSPVFAVADGNMTNYSASKGQMIIDHGDFKAKYEGMNVLCGIHAPWEEVKRKKGKGDHIGNASGLFHLEFYRERDGGRHYLDPLEMYGKETLTAYDINFSVDSACVYWSDKSGIKERSYINYASKSENQWQQTLPDVTARD